MKKPLSFDKLGIEHKRVIYAAIRYYQGNGLTSQSITEYNKCDEILNSISDTLNRYDLGTHPDFECDI